MEEVESEDGERDEAAPEMDGESRIDTGEACNEVGFKCVNCLIFRVGAVVIRGCELVFNVIDFEEILKGCRAFVVSDLEDWF